MVAKGKRMRLQMLSTAVLLCLAPPAFADCSDFEGAIVVTADGKYIGKVASKYAGDSIFNRYGTFGSKYNGDSIWNPYGQNGSPYSGKSAQNPYTISPPEMYKNRKLIGYLSVNKNLGGAINPLRLGIACYDYEPQ